MGEERFPNAKLEFMKKVRGKEAIKVKIKGGEACGKLREGILVEIENMHKYI